MPGRFSPGYGIPIKKSFLQVSPAGGFVREPGQEDARGLLHDNPLNLPRVLLRSAFLTFIIYQKLSLVGGADLVSAPPYALALVARFFPFLEEINTKLLVVLNSTGAG